MTDKLATRTSNLGSMLQAALPRLKTLAPKYVNPERLIALAMEARKNETLAKCSPESVVSFCKKCAEWGTDRIGSGGVWPVPYYNKKLQSYEMVAIPDWRMMIERLKRAGAIKHATSEAVYAADTFEYERGTHPRLTHKPALRDRGELVAAYCVYTLCDGTKDFVVMPASDVESIRQRSQASDRGPWVTDYAEMAKKTVTKRALKTFEGASIELTQMLESDNLVNGYAEPIDREPIMMPTPVKAPTITAHATSEPEKEETSEGPLPTAAKSEPAKPSRKREPEGETEIITGTLEVVSVKPTKKGTNRYGCKIGETWYGTFDDNTGADAEALKGEEVRATVSQRGQYWDLHAIEPAEVATEQNPDADDPLDGDNMPF